VTIHVKRHVRYINAKPGATEAPGDSGLTPRTGTGTGNVRTTSGRITVEARWRGGFRAEIVSYRF